jgi:Uma2 family endonuclease
MFATWDTLKSGRLAPPADRPPEMAIDLIGTPDWICEVVSDSSEEKDTQLLRAKYFAAGIHEYWLIDARGAEISFQILVPASNQYQQTKRKQAWQWSPTFSRWFELTRETNEVGRWTYDLKSKS